MRATRLTVVLTFLAGIVAGFNTTLQAQTALTGELQLNTFEIPAVRVVPVATGLVNPFAFAFRNNGDILVTERYSGKLRLIRQGQLQEAAISGVPKVYSEVVRAELATEPMHVAIVVDDNGGGFFQNGIIRLLTGLDGRAEFAVIAVNGSPTWLVDYTTEFGALQDALSGVGRRVGAPKDGQVLEALMDIGQRLQERRVARPVVVVFTVGGGSTSIRASNVRDRFKASGVLLHVVGTNLTRDVAQPIFGREDPADFQMAMMFDDGVTDTGGRVQEFTIAEGIETAAKEIVGELLNQYVISYTLPPGVEPNERLDVSVERRGVSLRAPRRIPVN